MGNRLCAGCKPTFARHMGDTMLDLLALRRDIELAQSQSRARGICRSERQMWIDYADRLEDALDIRIRLGNRDAASHERALKDTPTTMCRQYTRSEPSTADLLMAAARQSEAPSASPLSA